MNSFNISEIENIINLGKNEQVNPKIIGVIYSLGRDVQNEEEYQYSFNLLLTIYKGASNKVRTCVILAFSLLAVMYGKLDREIVEPIIKHEWNIADSQNKLIIRNAIDDINHSLNWKLKI